MQAATCYVLRLGGMGLGMLGSGLLGKGLKVSGYRFPGFGGCRLGFHGGLGSAIQCFAIWFRDPVRDAFQVKDSLYRGLEFKTQIYASVDAHALAYRYPSARLPHDSTYNKRLLALARLGKAFVSLARS